MRPRFLFCAVSVCLLVVLAACGSDSDDEATNEIQPTTTAAGSGEDSLQLEDTPVTADLDQTSALGPDGAPVAVDVNKLPVQPGAVTAEWYTYDDTYVVRYRGLALDDSAPLCAGNSIQVGTGFESLTNSPYPDGACSGKDLAPSGQGLVACKGLVLYTTAIPITAEGTLYATLARFAEDGSIAAVTSAVTADAEAATYIDPTATSFELPDGEIVSC